MPTPASVRHELSQKFDALPIFKRGHSLPQNREDRNRRIIDWFNKFE